MVSYIILILTGFIKIEVKTASITFVSHPCITNQKINTEFIKYNVGIGEAKSG